jgi:DtxR family Mn-dependent transcriptional regulator
MTPDLSESTEMYLVTVYRLTRRVAYASTSDIAVTLGVSLPSVSEKIKRLTSEGYVEHQWRQGVALTDLGSRIALNVLRKHRLAATFLVQQLGYALEEVYADACRLEHAISDRMADRLEEMLGFPEVDPHGQPIPAHDGTIALPQARSLASVAAGTSQMIRSVSVLDQKRLQYLCEIGLVPGKTIQVVAIAPFGGPITLELDRRMIALDRSLAGEIGVYETEEEQTDDPAATCARSAHALEN